jgi:hypothetical protein
MKQKQQNICSPHSVYLLHHIPASTLYLMKKKLLFLPAIWLLGCAETQHESNEVTLQRFYRWYVRQAASVPSRFSINDDTLKQYCTKSFLKNSFHDSALDYDPLLSAEKFNKFWATNIMTGRLEDSRVKMYRVSFQTDKQFHSHNIAVTLAKENGLWKIDYVKDIK